VAASFLETQVLLIYLTHSQFEWDFQTMSLMKKEHDGVMICVFTDQKILDEIVIEKLAEEMREVAETNKGGRILLNFGSVSFMSSQMLGKLSYINKKCKADETELKLCNLSDNLFDIFKITALDKVLDICKTEEKALASFGKKKGWFKW
jgi:anti-sigma B factor antagonist